MTFEFIGGPRDGARVPDMLWVLDVIEMEHKLHNGQVLIYTYTLDEDSKNWIFNGQIQGESNE
jgi:hypothetical protein